MKNKNQKDQSKNLLIIVLFFIIGFLVFFNRNNFSESIDSKLSQSQKTTCNLYGIGDLENYLPTYTVKAGDSLLSIARNELNSTDRVSEIVELNQSKYPNLSIENSFVEVGWELLLPPKNTEKTNGKIVVVHGNLSISDTGWGVNTPNSSVGPFNLSQLSNVEQQLNFSDNDCVTVISQGRDNYGEELKVFEIISQ